MKEMRDNVFLENKKELELADFVRIMRTVPEETRERTFR